MKIAHVTSCQVPGYGYEEFHLAHAQHALGHQVEVFTSNYLYPSFYPVLRVRFPQRQVAPRAEEQQGVKVHLLASREVFGRVWITGLERRIADFDPDIVHCHSLLQFHPPRLALSRALRRSRFDLVVCDHMHEIFVRRSTVGRLFYVFYRALVQPFMDRAVSCFSAITEATRDYLVRDCGVTRPVKVMPLGVDTAAFHSDPVARSLWRHEHEIGDDELVVLYVGKVIAEKGLDVLVGAAIRCIDAGQPLRVVMVGDADEDEIAKIRDRIWAAGKEKAFVILPSISHDSLRPVYAAADACVWPRQESMSLLEGMATSLPVVVSDASGYAAMVGAGAGLTFKFNDEASLAHVLERLRERELRDTLGGCGRREVEKELTWRHSAIRYLAEYERVRSLRRVTPLAH